jgi:hypothetical protein
MLPLLWICMLTNPNRLDLKGEKSPGTQHKNWGLWSSDPSPGRGLRKLELGGWVWSKIVGTKIDLASINRRVSSWCRWKGHQTHDSNAQVPHGRRQWWGLASTMSIVMDLGSGEEVRWMNLKVIRQTRQIWQLYWDKARVYKLCFGWFSVGSFRPLS